jgi:hypothetical protein
LHHHGNADQDAHDDHERDRFDSREEHLADQDPAHRAPPSPWLQAEEKRCPQHRREVLDLPALFSDQAAYAAQKFEGESMFHS